MALSIMPCKDSCYKIDIHNHKNSQSVSSNKQSNQKDPLHNDNCSPFCNCACCGCITSFLSRFNTINIIFNSLYVSNNCIDLNTPLCLTYIKSIWQPPK